MVALLAALILVASIMALGFFRASRFVWTACLAVVLLGISLWGHWSLWALIPIWLIFILVSAFFHFSFLRLRFITQPVLHYLSKALPPMSETERIAIEAGDVWWEGELFAGKPRWENFLQQPAPTLTEEEESFIANQVETLCAMINDWEIQQKGDLPDSIWAYLKQERFLGMVIAKEYGGLGFSPLGHSTVINKIASRSVNVVVNTMVPNSLGPAELLKHYGTQDQKNYYLPRLASGEEIPCFGLTSDEVGSDAGALTDRGVICRGLHEGKEVLGIRMNWQKRYITLAPIATVISIAFRLYDPEHLLGNQENVGITLALVPTKHTGVETGRRHWPVYLSFMNGPCIGKDVFIPLDWIVGGAAMAGQGWRMLMECLSIGRAISLPALSTANAKVCYRMTGAYARIRKQFNSSIGNFEGVQAALARIAGGTYLLEAVRLTTAFAVNQGFNPAVVSAIAKYHSTEWSRQIINDSLDIHGGRGVQAGPRNYLLAGYLGVPVGITVEGANILTRNLIIFGQGAIRCHPYLQQEMAIAQSEAPDRLQQFDKVLMQHLSYATRNKVRTFIYGLSGGWLAPSPVRGAMMPYYRQLNRMSAALAIVADTMMLLLGGSLKRKENLSARLGDVLSQLYLASCALKYYQDHGQPQDEEFHVRFVVETCLEKIQVAFDGLFANLPWGLLRTQLRFLVFPWGVSYRGPSDHLSQKLAEQLLSPSDLRNRLTKYCYVNDDEKDVTGRMEVALRKLVAAEAAEKKLVQAVKAGRIAKQASFSERIIAALAAELLTAQEVALLKEAELARADALKVDDFDFNLKT